LSWILAHQLPEDRSVLVDHLTRIFQDESDIRFAYFYCRYNERDTQTAGNVIASLTRQLFQANLSIPQVRALYQKHRKIDITSRPSLSEYGELLRIQSAACSKVFLIIDALDEFNDTPRNNLITELLSLPENTCLFITSRHVPSIKQQLNDPPTMEIRASDADMKLFLEAQIQKSIRLKSHLKTSPDLRQTMLDTIVSKAEGM
jgi:hypothetical protein